MKKKSKSIGVKKVPKLSSAALTSLPGLGSGSGGSGDGTGSDAGASLLSSITPSGGGPPLGSGVPSMMGTNAPAGNPAAGAYARGGIVHAPNNTFDNLPGSSRDYGKSSGNSGPM